MSYRIISPEFSFVQFEVSSDIGDCSNAVMTEVLPVVEDNDVWFQFILETDTKDEADILCGDQGSIVILYLSKDCANADISLDATPERSRIDETHVLYNWVHGFPGFTSVYEVGDCFRIFLGVVSSVDDMVYTFCSNPFKRADEGCFTSVVEYGNNTNFADFIYCPGYPIDAGDCTPTEISFNDQTNLSIPYTTSFLDKYGTIPTIQVWVYDGDGHLVPFSGNIVVDALPPTLITVDLAGTFSGIVKIS